MSFMTEVAQYKGGAGKAAPETVAAAPAATKAPEVTTKSSDSAPAEPQAPHVPVHGEVFDESKFNFDSNLPPGAAPVDPAALKVPDAPVVAKAPEAEVKKAPIKIGNQEFQTIDDAVEYAKQLEAEKAQNQAYIEGVKDASKKPAEPEAPKKTAYDIFAEKVFEDPVKAAQDFAESLKQEIRSEYNNSLQQQHQAKLAADSKAQAWDTFYKNNTDLSAPEVRDYVENYLLPKLAKDGTIKPTDSDTKFAELARKHLQIKKAATQPSTVLPAGPVTMPGASGEATAAATPAKTEEVVDLVTALNRLRKRKA